MTKYFVISTGPRGCYMSDSSHVVRVNTRRELKSILENGAETLRDAGYVVRKRAPASVAAAAWRNAHAVRPTYLPICIPARPSWGDHESYGIFVSIASRADYLEYCDSQA